MENNEENVDVKIQNEDVVGGFVKTTKRKFKWWIIPVILVGIILIATGSLIAWYYLNIRPVNKEQFEAKTLKIEIGTTNEEIAGILEDNNVIRNKLAFRIYVKLNKITGFQAGTYIIDKPYELNDIASLLKTGKIYSNETINITFVEGKNMRYIAKIIAQNTENTEEEVYAVLKDKEYIKSLIDDYWFITEEINNSNIYYSLEGYLFPDTYQFESTKVDIKTIFKTMLDKMSTVLDGYKENIDNNKYTVHQILSLASMIELEAKNAEDRAEVSGVFYNRLRKNMSLGSDVTTYYAYKVDMGERDLYMSEINGYNPYNTRGPKMEGKIPVGPISSVGCTSIEAAINPKTTDALYFVADKYGKVYFGKNNAEHEANIQNLKKQGLWFEY